MCFSWLSYFLGDEKFVANLVIIQLDIFDVILVMDRLSHLRQDHMRLGRSSVSQLSN
jgi:hypothetical protein